MVLPAGKVGGAVVVAPLFPLTVGASLLLLPHAAAVNATATRTVANPRILRIAPS